MVEFLSHLDTRPSTFYHIIGVQSDIVYVADDTPAKRWRDLISVFGIQEDHRPNALRIIGMDVYGSCKNWKTIVEIPFVGQTVCEHEERCRFISSSIAVYGFSQCRKFIYALAYGREDNKNRMNRPSFHLYKISIETGEYSSYKLSLASEAGQKSISTKLRTLREHHICACCCGTVMIWTSHTTFTLTRTKFADEEAFLTFLESLPPHIMHFGVIDEEKQTFHMSAKVYPVPAKLREDDWVFDMDDTRITLLGDHEKMLISMDEENLALWNLKEGTAEFYKPSLLSDYDFSSAYGNIYSIDGRLFVVTIGCCRKCKNYYALYRLELDHEALTYKCRLIFHKPCLKWIRRVERTNFYDGNFFLEISPKTMKTVLLRMPTLAEWSTYYLQQVHPETSEKFSHLFLAEHGVPRRSKRERHQVDRYEPSRSASKRKRMESMGEEAGPSTSKAIAPTDNKNAIGTEEKADLNETHAIGSSGFLKIRF